MAVRGVRDRGKVFVVEVEREASVDVDHFTGVCISTGVGRERTWTHPSLARTMRSIRSSSFCRSTSTTHASSGNKELEHTQSSDRN